MHIIRCFRNIQKSFKLTKIKQLLSNNCFRSLPALLSPLANCCLSIVQVSVLNLRFLTLSQIQTNNLRTGTKTKLFNKLINVSKFSKDHFFNVMTTRTSLLYLLWKFWYIRVWFCIHFGNFFGIFSMQVFFSSNCASEYIMVTRKQLFLLSCFVVVVLYSSRKVGDIGTQKILDNVPKFC